VLQYQHNEIICI